MRFESIRYWNNMGELSIGWPSLSVNPATCFLIRMGKRLVRGEAQKDGPRSSQPRQYQPCVIDSKIPATAGVAIPTAGIRRPVSDEERKTKAANAKSRATGVLAYLSYTQYIAHRLYSLLDIYLHEA